MSNTGGSLRMFEYRAPPGRPQSCPPMDVPIACATGNPVSDIQRKKGAAGSAALKLKLAQDPAFAAEFSRKVSAGMAKKYRLQAAAKAVPNGAQRWHGYGDLAAITGLSYWTVRGRVMAAKWPMRRVRRLGQSFVEVFGDPATIPLKPSLRAKPAPAVVRHEPVVAVVETLPAPVIAPPRSIWSRLFGWVVGR